MNKLKKQSFTLVEAVIIVMIISIFFLLSHGIAKAASKQLAVSPAIKCTSNLKKLYQVFINYANDYDDSLPIKINSSGGKSPWLYILAKAYPDKFKGKLWSKLGGRRFWHCPSCQLNDWKDSSSGGASDYGLNAIAFTAPGKLKTVKMKDSAPNPENKFLLADAPLTGYRPYIYPVSYLSISNRHDLKGNYIFFDGHVTAYKKKDVYRWKEKDWTAFARDSNQQPWNCNLSNPKFKTKNK
jgi:prepilin-type processing-associated H-X9-DG protein